MRLLLVAAALLVALVPQPPIKHHLDVVSGSGSGDYVAGARVTIVADKQHGDEVFAQWFAGWDGDTTIEPVHHRKATLTMPNHDATVEARFTAAPPKRKP